jgi:uncharacterized membrane protein HdeD (DUF308 family)
MNLEQNLQEGERELAHIWKGMAWRGVAGIVFAVIILVWPNIGLATLIALFGAFALVTGIATLVGAFSSQLPGNRRAGLVVEGLLGIAVGVVVFVWPDLSALGLLYAIAAWAIATGILEIGLAFSLPISGRRALLLGLSGVFAIAFGVIMFAHPGAGAIALLGLIAAFALVTGIMQVSYAFELRRLAGEVKRPVRRQTTAKPVEQG